VAIKNVIGVIFQIETSKGPAYGLCTHENEYYKSYLVHLYPIGTELSELKETEPQFCCLLPLRTALRQKCMKEIIKEVGKMEIPEQLKKFPLFRNGIAGPGTLKVNCWSFWDGEKHWDVGDITDEQRKMPVEGICNTASIIWRLETGYTAEKNPLI
jgi:hypothetical protein